MVELSMDKGLEAYIELLKKVLTASIYDESAWSIKKPARMKPGGALRNIGRKLKGAMLNALRKRSLLLVEVRPFDEKLRNEGMDWPLFGYTMAGHRRLDNVQKCVEDVLKNDIPGDFIETGSWRGGMTIFMRALLKAYGVKDRKVWVADSFEGLPVPKDGEDGADLSHVDTLAVSLETVQSNFRRFDLLDDQVEFLKGWFCDTLPGAAVEKISILRLDGDLYSSTMDALKNLYHKVSKGGYVIVDDFYTWPACKRAVTDFLKENNLDPELIEIDGSAVYWQV